MDGLVIAATTMCPTDDCPVCESPKDELDKTDLAYPLRCGETVKSQVDAAQADLLNPDGLLEASRSQGPVQSQGINIA